MKKILLSAAIPSALVIVFGVTPYYLGKKAQQSLDTQYRTLADTFFFDIVSRDYERGWFSSTETTVVRFHPTILSKINNQLPDNIRILFDKPVIVVNHIKHGLFADGLKPVRAVVTTELRYDPEVKKVLDRFFGDKVVFTAHNVIELNGAGELKVQISPFDYEELSGIKLNWQGMHTTINYQNEFKQYNSHFIIPAFKAQLADQGTINLEHIEVKTQSEKGKNITLGTSESQLKNAEIIWNNDITYNIRLNDLINMVTDLQIGAFINPNGNIAPNKITINNLFYKTQTTPADAEFINSRGIFTFNQLKYGQETYGPLTIDIIVEHLHSKSLEELKNKWTQIANTTHDEQEAQNLAIAAARKEGAGIFTRNPIFKIEKFNFNTPNGHIDVNGTFELKDLTKPDLYNFKSLLQKIHANLFFDVSQVLLENFAITQARSLFTVEDPTDAQEQKEIDDTIRMLTVESINNMVHSGYINKENGAIKTQFTFENSQISLNGKPFEAQSNDDLFDQLEAEATSGETHHTPNH